MFSLAQFKSVFKVRDSKGQPYILIGGQAVNFWATRYLSVEPEMAAWLPFTSADIDFKGTRRDAEHIAQQLGLHKILPPIMAITALAGAIPLTVDGAPGNIEIVRLIPGVSDREAEEHAVEREFEGETIRVLDPISLLYAKARLALLVSQKERRDVDHVKILIYCVRAFLREALDAAEHDSTLVRGWLGATEKTLALTESTTGARLTRRFAVNWPEILPFKEIRKSPLPKVIQFRQKRLPTWEQKLSPK